MSCDFVGIHQDFERKPASLQISSEAIQSAGLTKTASIKSKRSRKLSGFCKVLKQFLPIGWRSASVRHRKGLFLDVEGLKPHRLSPALKVLPGNIKRNAQRFDAFAESTSTQSLLLDVSDVYTYVKRYFELSGLIVDPSPVNWYDSKKPMGEDTVCAWESPCCSAGHSSGLGSWQMHKKLLLDLINGNLLNHFAVHLLVPSFGMETLALPASGEKVVEIVTKEIVELERHASLCGYNIEKVIAKAFENEQWEKCAEEAKDIASNMAQAIFCDLIESFVYEMVRGWGHQMNQRPLTAYN